MTENQRLKKLETLEEINSRIGACFGDQDKVFAGHPMDEKYAKEFRKKAFENGITLSEIQNIVSGFLYRSGWFSEHCKEQTEKATKYFMKKLK